MDDREQQPVDDIAAVGAPASPDALRNIVAKHRRSRTRTLGVLLAVALVAGPAAGWLLGHNGGGGQRVATASSPQGNAPNVAAPQSGEASSASIGFPGANPPKADHLFTRTTADGIVIRAYRLDPPTPPANTTPASTPAKQQTICPRPMTVKPGAPAGAESGAVSSGGAETAPAPPVTEINGTPPPVPCDPGAPPICKSAPSVLAEVSNDAAVGQSVDPIDDKQPTDALSHLSVGGFGVAEGSPATIVTVQTGPGVATVRLRLPDGGTDEMAPANGVAVLARGGTQPPADGTVVEALDAGGKVLQSLSVNQPEPKAIMGCAYATGPALAKPATPPTTR